MAHRFERDPDYVTDRTAAVNHLGLHYGFAVFCVAAFLAVNSLADASGGGPSLAPVIAATDVPSGKLYGSLACDDGFRSPSS